MILSFSRSLLCLIAASVLGGCPGCGDTQNSRGTDENVADSGRSPTNSVVDSGMVSSEDGAPGEGGPSLQDWTVGAPHRGGRSDAAGGADATTSPADYADVNDADAGPPEITGDPLDGPATDVDEVLAVRSADGLD